MKENNILVKAVFFVVLAITLTVGVTYAYFKVNITGLESTSTISIGGATLKIVYEGTETITAENIIPGWSAKKYFNVDVTNTSGTDISYDINLVVLNSNFYTTSDLGNSYLEYALYECESNTDKTCERKIQSASILDIQSGSKLVNSVTTDTSSKTYYALEILFPNQDAEQSQTGTDENPLTFSGYVTLVSSDKVYDATPVSFAEDSWETIAFVVKKQKELSSSVYAVGDTKEIVIEGFTNGEEGSNGLYTVRIANNSHYDCIDDEGNQLESQTACGFVVEFVDMVEKRVMNTAQTNKGGWPATPLYKYINGDTSDHQTYEGTSKTLFSRLSSDLQKVIIDTKAISSHGPNDSNSEREDGNWESTDKLYLLSVSEVYNNITSSESTRQMDYYEINNVHDGSHAWRYEDAIKFYDGYSNNWFLRTANSSDQAYFNQVLSGGGFNLRGLSNTDNALGLAFRIG